MKALCRRLRRIELQLTPKANPASQQAAQLLWERRRRRALANASLSTNHRQTRARCHRADGFRLRRRSVGADN
jgi:hypothetical protein